MLSVADILEQQAHDELTRRRLDVDSSELVHPSSPTKSNKSSEHEKALPRGPDRSPRKLQRSKVREFSTTDRQEGIVDDVRRALEVFEDACRLSIPSAAKVNFAEEVRLADAISVGSLVDEKMQHVSIQELLSAGEKLLAAAGRAAAVAASGGSPNLWPSWALTRLPRVMIRKAMHVGWETLLPERRERDRLRAKVTELTTSQLQSTKNYLEELSCLRRRLHNAPPPTPRTNSEYVVQLSSADDSGKFSLGLGDRYAWEVIDVLPGELQAIVVAVLQEKLRCYSTQGQEIVLADLAALVKRVRRWHEMQGLPEREVVHAETRNLDHLTISDRRELKGMQKLNQELEAQLHDQVAVNKSLEEQCTACHQEFAARQAEDASIRTDRAQLKSLQEQVAIFKQVHQSYDGGEQAKALSAALSEAEDRIKALERAADERAARCVRISEKLTPLENQDRAGLRESLVVFLSGIADLFDDPVINAWVDSMVQAVITKLIKTDAALEIQEVTRRGVERKLRDAERSKRDLECQLTEQKEALAEAREKLAAMQQEVQVSTPGEVQDVESTQLYAQLLIRFRDMEVDYSRVKGCLLAAEQRAFEAEEVTSRNKEVADLQVLTAQQLLQKLRVEHQDLTESHKKLQVKLDNAVQHALHPARMAEVKAQVHRLQHECEATSNINTFFRAALESLRRRLGESMSSNLQGSQLRESIFCALADMGRLEKMNIDDRSVFTRLYEDAVRRHDKGVDASDVKQAAGLSGPARIDSDLDVEVHLPAGFSPLSVQRILRPYASEPDVHKMRVTNARGLGYWKAMPLFPDSLRPVPPGSSSPRLLLETPIVVPVLSDLQCDIDSRIDSHVGLQDKRRPMMPDSAYGPETTGGRCTYSDRQLHERSVLPAIAGDAQLAGAVVSAKARPSSAPTCGGFLVGRRPVTPRGRTNLAPAVFRRSAALGIGTRLDWAPCGSQRGQPSPCSALSQPRNAASASLIVEETILGCPDVAASDMPTTSAAAPAAQEADDTTVLAAGPAMVDYPLLPSSRPKSASRAVTHTLPAAQARPRSAVAGSGTAGAGETGPRPSSGGRRPLTGRASLGRRPHAMASLGGSFRLESV